MPNKKIVPFKGETAKRQTGRQRPAVLEPGEYADRIRSLRLQNGYSQPELAEAVGVTKNAVCNWEAGRTRPDLDTIKLLCIALHTSADILLGIYQPKDEYSEREIKFMQHYRCLMPHDRKLLDTLINTMHEEQYRDFCHNYHSNFAEQTINELSACAGSGIELTTDNAESETIILRKTPAVQQCDEIIRIVGDSMLPTYHSGDMVLVEHTEEIFPGEIGIFVFNGEGMIKEYQSDGLHAHNQSYGVITPTDNDDFRCIGRVIGKLTEDMYPSPNEQIMINEMLYEQSDK